MFSSSPLALDRKREMSITTDPSVKSKSKSDPFPGTTAGLSLLIRQKYRIDLKAEVRRLCGELASHKARAEIAEREIVKLRRRQQEADALLLEWVIRACSQRDQERINIHVRPPDR
jgi:hypothetical protein